MTGGDLESALSGASESFVRKLVRPAQKASDLLVPGQETDEPQALDRELRDHLDCLRTPPKNFSLARSRKGYLEKYHFCITFLGECFSCVLDGVDKIRVFIWFLW
jgi:hypothetical protein